MTALSEYRTKLETLLSSVNLSGFFSDTMKDDWINTAGRRVCNFGKWDWLNHALKTQSEAGNEWYAEPDTFKKNSIFRLTMEDDSGDDQEYDLISWNLYQEHKELETESKVSSIFKNQFFLYPVPTEDNRVIGVYGQLQWAELTDDADESITPESTDEAVVKLAFASALRKESRFNEANSEVSEVEQNILPRLLINQNKDTPRGYVGKTKHSRWN